MRFVKRKQGSSKEKNRQPRRKKLKTLFNVAFLLSIALAFFTANFTLKPLASLSRVDPSVLQSLREGEPVEAFVVADATAKLSGEKEWHFGDVKVVKVRLLSEHDLNGLLAVRGVRSVWGSKIFKHPTPSYSVVDTTYNLSRDIKWEVHKRNSLWTGRGVTVAIIDTGIDYTHLDFFDADNNTIVKAFVSVLFVSTSTGKPVFWIPQVNGSIDALYAFDMALYSEYNETAFLDINGHGTHVAGIVAGRGWASGGRYRGLAPEASLVVIKAFNSNGYSSMESCLDALEWVYDYWGDYDIRVLSLSWGAAMASDGSDPISVACNQIAKQGVFVFAAAGNWGNFPTTIMVPAVARLVYAVGAWDGYTNKIAPFSSIGTTIDFRMKPDMIAVGVKVVSCKSNYVEFPDYIVVDDYYVALDGTSMATPAAAAICADFIEYYRYWHKEYPSREDWEKYLEYNAKRLNPFFKDFISGWGIPVSP